MAVQSVCNEWLSNGARKADLARQLNIAPTLADRLSSLKHKSRVDQVESALALLAVKLMIEVTKVCQ